MAERTPAEIQSFLEAQRAERADAYGGTFQSAQAPDGSWVVSIEQEDQAIIGQGKTKIKAMSDLLSNAPG